MNASTMDVPTEATLRRVVTYERVSYEDQRSRSQAPKVSPTYRSQCVKRVLGLDTGQRPQSVDNPLTFGRILVFGRPSEAGWHKQNPC